MYRIELEALVNNLLLEAKQKCRTWDRLAEEMNVTTVTLHRYRRAEALPTLEIYSVLCEIAGRRCYSDVSSDDSGHFFVLKARLFCSTDCS